MELYDNPRYYTILFGERNFKEETHFIVEVLKKYSKIKINTILDIACGDGPHMEELAKRGFKVAGLDNSKKMLSLLNTRFKDNPNLITVYKKDMANFKLNKKFDACICMVNSLEILNSNEQFISHFNSVSNCLNKGGLYFVELDNPACIFSNPLPGEKEKIYKKTINKGKIKMKIKYTKYPFDIANFLEKNNLIVDINDGGEKFKVSDDSPVRRLTLSDLGLFARLNGRLKILAVYGGFNEKSKVNDKNSDKMVVVFRKL